MQETIVFRGGTLITPAEKVLCDLVITERYYNGNPQAGRIQG